MIWHGTTLDLFVSTNYHLKYNSLDCEILKTFHICVKTFDDDDDDTITIIVFDILALDIRARLWDSVSSIKRSWEPKEVYWAIRVEVVPGGHENLITWPKLGNYSDSSVTKAEVVCIKARSFNYHLIISLESSTAARQCFVSRISRRSNFL